ncbi:hypothetical protein [Pseudochrobactrum sp. B5]|uniref:hypothetical protein n=1 Tax=Pseudochrobactrum sp. B5 TaxID=1289478 RepID=UPI000A50EDAD|nr:hypothetical protein [Pseudochrobactrum sp. B5]
MDQKAYEIAINKLQALAEESVRLSMEISERYHRLREIEAELKKLRDTIQVNIVNQSERDINMVNGVQISPLSTEPIIINGTKIRRNTIKDYVVQVLSDSKKGMTALDILYEINSRFGKSYDRPSLSPQLSRLKENGVLGLRGSVWYLKPENDIFD